MRDTSERNRKGESSDIKKVEQVIDLLPLQQKRNGNRIGTN